VPAETVQQPADEVWFAYLSFDQFHFRCSVSPERVMGATRTYEAYPRRMAWSVDETPIFRLYEVLDQMTGNVERTCGQETLKIDAL
jgi:hypothetical protein